MVRVTELPKGFEVFTATPKALEDLWNNAACKEILFPDECNLSYGAFAQALTSSLVLCYGPGLLRISKVVHGTRCEIHGFILKAPLSRYRAKFKECMLWLFQAEQVPRIECFIPERAKSLKRFLLSVGFEIEGLLRNRRKYRGRFENEIIMSMVEEEYHERR